jgi:exopolyphosphatase/guanosine-5'-triphosphate,3'-diphosphate pyrophosphatase
MTAKIQGTAPRERTGVEADIAANPRPAGPAPRPPVYAAVDLGTHNCRLLIAEGAGELGFRVIGSFSRAVRLGEGLAANGRLARQAIDRSIEALGICASRMRTAGVRRARAIATEPCRRAENGPEFLRRVKAETGLSLESISSEEEARLTLAGCVPLLDPSHARALLIDIGGGSTEVTWIEQAPGRDPKVIGLLSLPHGVVSFAERYGGDRVGPETFEEMVGTVDAALGPFDKRHGIGDHVARGQVQLVGTSGTVTTLAAAHLGLRYYARSRVDGLDIAFEDLDAVSARFVESDWDTRARNRCIGPERADLVVGGCAILQAIRRRWPVGRLKVADRGIREGLLLALVAADGARGRGAES